MCVHAHFWAAGEKVTKTWFFCPPLFRRVVLGESRDEGAKKNFTKIGGSVSTQQHGKGKKLWEKEERGGQKYFDIHFLLRILFLRQVMKDSFPLLFFALSASN